MGSVMGVVQVTVQNAAGAGCSVRPPARFNFRARSAASFGTALVGALLLPIFTARDPGGVGVFANLLEHGPSALAGLAPGAQALARTSARRSFRAVFLTVDAFAALALVFAWTIPTRRL